LAHPDYAINEQKIRYYLDSELFFPLLGNKGVRRRSRLTNPSAAAVTLLIVSDHLPGRTRWRAR